MNRKHIDCREHPQTGTRCTVAICADTEDELIEAAVQHVTQVHGYEDTPDVRNGIRGAMKEGSCMD